MTNDNLYKADLDKLDKYYKVASENSGKPQQFYTSLYKYVQVIDENKFLSRAANEFWFLEYIEDNKTDENKLPEFLAPLAKTNGKELNPMQQLQLMLRLFGQISSEKIKETKVYYCWYLLYFNFYSMHKSNIDPKAIAKLSDVDPRKVAAYLKESLGEDMPELSEELLASLKPINTKELADKFERITSSVIPHDSSITIDEYETSLGLFHTEFTPWLVENVDRLATTESQSKVSEPRTKVTLSFPGRTAKIVEVETGKPYFLSELRKQNAPYKIYEYCLEKVKWVSFSEVIESLELYEKNDKKRKRNVPEILRNSLFGEGNALEPFIKINHKEEQLMAFSNKSIDSKQLQIIKDSVVEKDVTKLVTGS